MSPVTHALWTKLDLLTVPQLHQAIEAIIQEGRTELVLNVNIHCMNLAYKLPWFRRLLNEAPIVFCDGFGVALGLRLFAGVRVPQRITYADWAWQLAEFCSERGYSFYFVGGRPGVAREASERLRQRYPQIKIAGCDHGYFDRNGPENEAVISRINAARPNVLIIGFGMPLQEEWLGRNRRALNANVLLTGGAVFDYVSGRTARGPRFLVDHGAEWLVRLVQEPRRLWLRYVVGNPVFLYRAWRWTRTHGRAAT